MHHPLLLGGEEIVLSQGYPVVNPATEEIIAMVSDAGYQETMQALDSAAKSFVTWKNMSPSARADILLTAYHLMRKQSKALAKTITAENGKPLKEAEAEVFFASEYLRWFAEEARRTYGETIPSPDPKRRFFTTREPIGVVGAIVPWNFPANMITRKCAPALAAGCPVVLKPAPETPLTALHIGKILYDAGLPKGVLSVLPSNRASEISKAFFDHSAVRAISFTGSTGVGKLLAQQAAGRICRMGLELGGNAPAIVFEDADLDKAVREIVGIKFLRAGGESCICANRIFVQQSIYEKFRSKMWEAMGKLKMDHGEMPGTDLGPVITAQSKKRLNELLADATQRGAKITQIPLSHQKGFFVPLTLVENVPEDARLVHEEIFGPILPLYSFSTESEVIERANAVPYGLSSYIFTESLTRALRVGGAIEAGFVGINDGKGYVHETPMGGYKESGIGREGGREGMHEYLEIKCWNIGGIE